MDHAREPHHFVPKEDSNSWYQTLPNMTKSGSRKRLVTCAIYEPCALAEKIKEFPVDANINPLDRKDLFQSIESVVYNRDNKNTPEAIEEVLKAAHDRMGLFTPKQQRKIDQGFLNPKHTIKGSPGDEQ